MMIVLGIGLMIFLSFIVNIIFFKKNNNNKKSVKNVIF